MKAETLESCKTNCLRSAWSNMFRFFAASPARHSWPLFVLEKGAQTFFVKKRR